jgi:hypothetical protein
VSSASANRPPYDSDRGGKRQNHTHVTGKHCRPPSRSPDPKCASLGFLRNRPVHFTHGFEFMRVAKAPNPRERLSFGSFVTGYTALSGQLARRRTTSVSLT